MANVLFSTNCDRRDLEWLSAGGFEYKAGLNAFPFAERWIIINNVDDELIAQRAFSGSSADRIILMSDKSLPAFRHFGLPEDAFVDPKTKYDGYIYSIDSLIELAFGGRFDYICHYCGDVELYRKKDWITEGIRKIEEEGYAGARPKLPIYSDSPAEEQELTETDVFSDHVYLIPWKPYHDALPDIFQLDDPSCDTIHPKYGGESFERKMTRYLKHTGQKLAIIQNALEMHPVRR